ncbi:cation:proton antiporter [Actinomycetota bacterium Odt1-20B]
MMLLTGLLLSRLARKVGLPTVIGEITAGIVLGPSLLGLLPGHVESVVFPVEVRPYLSAVAQVGLLLFMFLIGWRTDPRLFGATARRATAVSLSAVAVSFGCGVSLAALLYSRHSEVGGHHVRFGVFSLFLGTALAITAFPVLARILAEKRLTRTQVGVTALTAAAMDDVLAWCLLALCAALVTAHSPAEVGRILLLSAFYLLTLALVARPLLTAFVTRRTERHPGELLAVVAAGVFLSSYATTWIGIHAIFGAFAFGVVMPREPADALRTSVLQPLDHISQFLLPAFFIVTGFGVDIGGLCVHGWLELTAVIGLACAGKVIGTLIPARASRLTWADTRTLCLLMNTRGLTEIVVLNTGVALKVIDQQVFTMGVLMALVTTALSGLVKASPAREPHGSLSPCTRASAAGPDRHPTTTE